MLTWYSESFWTYLRLSSSTESITIKGWPSIYIGTSVCNNFSAWIRYKSYHFLLELSLEYITNLRTFELPPSKLPFRYKTSVSVFLQKFIDPFGTYHQGNPPEKQHFVNFRSLFSSIWWINLYASGKTTRKASVLGVMLVLFWRAVVIFTVLFVVT